MQKFIGTVAIVLVSLTASAKAEDKCGQAAFAAVVSEAGAQLTALNDENKKSFHGKLQTLKVREAWTDADYVAKATPFVKDERIAAFDLTSNEILGRVQQLGQPGPGTVTASVAAPISTADTDTARRCAMLEELRGLMAQVVVNTRAKWGYMHGKLDAASDSLRQAKAQ